MKANKNRRTFFNQNRIQQQMNSAQITGKRIEPYRSKETRTADGTGSRRKQVNPAVKYASTGTQSVIDEEKQGQEASCQTNMEFGKYEMEILDLKQPAVFQLKDTKFHHVNMQGSSPNR